MSVKHKSLYTDNDTPNQPSVAARPGTSSERRQFLRVQLQTRGYYYTEHQDDWIECVMVDISQGGAQVSLPGGSAQDGIGDVIALKFRIGAEYHIEAKIVWVDSSPRQRRLGLEWIHLPDQKRQRLAWELMRLAVHRRRAHRPLL